MSNQTKIRNNEDRFNIEKNEFQHSSFFKVALAKQNSRIFGRITKAQITKEGKTTTTNVLVLDQLRKHAH